MSPQREIVILTWCPGCYRDSRIVVPKAGYDAWKSGVLIQNALPTVSKDHREQLQTGICAECWDRMFKESD